MGLKKSSVLIVLLLIVLPSCSSYEKSKVNKLYIAGVVGTGQLNESEDEVDLTSDSDQTIDGSTNFSAILGYRFKIFALEFMATSLGKSEIQFEDKYTEIHDARFIGGGFHWTWNWFDLKLGYGNVKDKVSFESQTIDFDPKNSSTSSLGSYFGLGANFNLGKDTEFIFDYTAYAWEDDTKRSWSRGTSSGSSNSKKNAYVTLGVGIRWFL